MSSPIDVSTREALLRVTEWALENDLIFCDRGRRAYYEAVLRELNTEALEREQELWSVVRALAAKAPDDVRARPPLQTSKREGSGDCSACGYPLSECETCGERGCGTEGCPNRDTHFPMTIISSLGRTELSARQDVRDLDHARRRAEDALDEYVRLEFAWNEPDHEHTRYAIRQMAERAIKAHDPSERDTPILGAYDQEPS